MNTLHCPNCQIILTGVKIRTSFKGSFIINHCQTCAGTWFDNYELNRTPLSQIEKLIDAHTNLPATSKQILYCPKDNTGLEHFHPEAAPPHVFLRKCSLCRGIWTDAYSLHAFKLHQQENIRTIKKSGIAIPALSAVFIPALALTLVLITAFTGFRFFSENDKGSTLRMTAKQSSSPVSNRQIVRLSPGSVRISFISKYPAISEISYGENKDSLTTIPVSPVYSNNHSITLLNLPQDAVYSILLKYQNGTQSRSPFYKL